MGTLRDRELGAIATYRAELARRKILTPEVEHALALRFRAGDREAGRALVEACLSSVVTIAREYRCWGLPFEDVVQEGNLGLLKAAERFDPDRGARLATYAAYWIRAEIREYVTRQYRIVRLATSKAERRALRLYRTTLIKDPAALAALSGLSEERANALLPVIAAADVRLDGQPGDEGRAPVDWLVDGGGSPEEQVGLAEERAQIEEALSTVIAELTPREQRIVYRRLLADEPETLEQLGAAFGVSKERARQVEVGATKRMRGRLQEIAGELVALRA